MVYFWIRNVFHLYGQYIIGNVARQVATVSRSNLGVARNLQKCNSHISRKNQVKQRRQAVTFYANVVMATTASLPMCACFAVWAILASLWEHLTCRCLHVEPNFSLRYKDQQVCTSWAARRGGEVSYLQLPCYY